MLEWWRKTNGLHTVQKWCTNYKKHPAGWGALLMIHGVPEVSLCPNRLHLKLTARLFGTNLSTLERETARDHHVGEIK